MQLHYLNEPEGEIEPRPPDRKQSKAEGKDKGELEGGDEEPRSFASPLQVINAMEEAFRKDRTLLPRLYGRARKLIRFYFHNNMLYDLTAADVFHCAISPLIKGQRKWYQDKVPDIVPLMFLVLHSYIRNERKKKKPLISGIELYNKDGELIEADIVDLQRAYLREDLEDKDLSLELEKNIMELKNELENDTIAYFVLEELLEIDHTQIKKPEAFIAEKLQLTEPEVKNAIRRIRRRVHKLLSKS